MFNTPLLEKKSLTKDADKGTDKFADMPLMERKSSTKDVDKGTDELEYMKHVVFTIYSKGLYQFEGQSKGYNGWFKLGSGLKKTIFLQFIQNYIKNLK